MQDHRDIADRSANGQKDYNPCDYHEAASFQDGYFRSGDERQLDYHQSSSRGSHDDNKDTKQVLQDHLSSSFNLWEPSNSHSDTTPTHGYNSSSLGVNSSGFWAPSLLGEKSPGIPGCMREKRGPLDVHTSPISSPVSSSENSVKPGLHNITTAVESQWEQATNTSHYPNNARYPSSNFSTVEEDEAALHQQQQQQMRVSLELANRLASSSELQKVYSSMVPNASMSTKLDSNNLWYSDQRGQFDAESAYDLQLRSTASSSVNIQSDSSQSRAFQIDQRAMDQFVPLSLDNTSEFSIFVGDLSPDLREEDLVAQFLHPSAWPTSHPFAIAHAHAQQAKGNYASPAKIRPAPFTSTKSAKIMKDPLTGVSRGFGFVRFSKEEDCARALVEMQGIVINPLNGPGRPLRVCTATPKNRTVAQSVPATPWSGSSLTDALSLYQQFQVNSDRLPLLGASLMHEKAAAASSTNYSKTTVSALFSPTEINLYNHLPATESPASNSNSMAYSNSALDPNNTTVFVGGLSSLISEDTLKTFFAPFGEIIYVKIPPGKGCGFVQFVKKIDAERAIERMQGFPIGGGRIRLSWGRSQGDKAAAAAAQVVAQTAQISQLASLANLSGMTSAQVNNLTAGMPNSTNETEAKFLQRLVALTASSNMSSYREKEDVDTQRVDSLQHLPAMEHQHRQAQRQATGSLGFPFDMTENQAIPIHAPYSAQWSDREQHNISSTRGSVVTDEYLASLIPSLRLGESEQRSLSASRHSITSPTSTDGRYYTQPLSPIERMKSPAYKSSHLFNPFNSPMLTSGFDEGIMSQFSNSKEQRHQHDNASDNAFLRYLETDRQQKQNEAADQYKPNFSSSFGISSIASPSES